MSTPFFEPAPIGPIHNRFFALTRQLQRRNADLDAFILAWRHGPEETPIIASNQEHMTLLIGATERALEEVMEEAQTLHRAEAGFLHLNGLEHLLRTPFTFVRGYWELIGAQSRSGAGLPGFRANIQEYVGGIMTGIARLNAECIKLLRLVPAINGFGATAPIRFVDIAGDIHRRHELMRYSAEKQPVAGQAQVTLLEQITPWPPLNLLRQGLEVIYDELLWAIEENQRWQVDHVDSNGTCALFEFQFATFPATFHYTPAYARAMGGSAVWLQRAAPTLRLALPAA